LTSFVAAVPSQSPTASAPTALEANRVLRGVLHVFVAFDWGEEIDLAHARKLIAAPEAIPATEESISSIAYRPQPLRAVLDSPALELPAVGRVEPSAEAVIFDFAATGVALHIPFALNASEICLLAAALSKPEMLHAAARQAVQPLHDRMLPAIYNPRWSDLIEEFLVFEFSPSELCAETVLAQAPQWLAGLVRLESDPLFEEEVAEALRLRIRYSARDLLIADWAAAVVIDDDCRQALQVIEFANLQLLEFREIDNRLDDRLAETYGLVRVLAHRWLPFWRPYTGQLRALGELKVEANTVFERTQNAVKLVGDQYLARVYRLLATRFYLEEWQQSVQRSLDVIESAYQVLADQAAAWRSEILELIIVVLIVAEILLTLLGY
jgi:hypothetical protein